MTTITVHELVKVVGATLETEDRYVLGCSAATAKSGGILRFPSERYYQFVALRGLLSRWDVNPEQALHDLVIAVGGESSAVIEMKCWRSAKGMRELSGIAKDIQKLASVASRSAAFMMIFSTNDPDRTEENVEFLIKQLPELAAKEREVYRFSTFDGTNQKRDFWVAGWQIKAGSCGGSEKVAHVCQML
jgi:hypothetical protein